jgi:hypothetical protein
MGLVGLPPGSRSLGTDAGEVHDYEGKGDQAEPVHEDGEKPARSVQTIQSKFLEVLSDYASSRGLELVVDFEASNSGYGYIQKNESFSNLYAFHFEFSSEAATFLLDTEKASAAAPERKRDVEFSGGGQLEQVMDEIRKGVDAAAERMSPSFAPVFPRAPPTRVATNDTKADHMRVAGAWRDEQQTSREMSSETTPPPPSSRLPTIAVVLVILALVLFFALPIFQTANAACTAGGGCIGVAHGGSFYYSSASFHMMGVGGEYFPPGQGWHLHNFLGVGTSVTGGRVYGFAIGPYYFTL